VLVCSGGAWIFKRWCEKRIGRPPALPPLSLPPPLALPPPLPLPRPFPPFPSPVPPLFLIRYSPSLFRPSLSPPSPLPPLPFPLPLPFSPFPPIPSLPVPSRGSGGRACRSVLGHFRALKCLHCKASFILNKTDFYFLHSTS